MRAGSPQSSSCDRDVNDLDVLLRPFFIRSRVFDSMHNIQALDRSTKYSVLPVEPWLLLG